MTVPETTSAVPSAAKTDVHAQLKTLLRDRLPSGAIITEPAAVAVASRVWNAEVTHQPAAVVRCADAEHVRVALDAARQVGLPVSVLGGGHSWSGSSIREGGVVVDLSSMREVVIEGDTALVSGGARLSDLLDRAVEHGSVPVVGMVGSVGVTGLTLGGGYGALIGQAGLAVDNLVSAEVVLADGRIVETDAQREPDLYWALRGGGGNFGVVTRLRTRLHSIPEVTSGQIAFSWDQARSILVGWAELMERADDALDVKFVVAATSHGRLLTLIPTWSGPPDQAEAQIAAVRALGQPVLDDVVRVPLAVAVHAIDDMYGQGSYFVGSRILPALTSEAIDALLQSAEAMPGTCVLYVHYAHGAATRVGVDQTAHAYRAEHSPVEILGHWADGDGTAETAWVRETEARLDRHALPGGWVNVMASGDPRARDAFGPNTQRLLAIKAQYDPDGVFAAQPLPT